MKRLGMILLLGCLWAVGAVQAAELTHVSGPVQVLGTDGKVRNAAARTGDRVEPGESVRALAGGKAMIRQDGGRYTVLTANSQVKIEEAGLVEQVRGAVYYVLRKLSSGEVQPAHQVKTSVATIGIRGTRFLVSTEGDSGEVALAEGLIDMQANEGRSFDIQKLPGNMSFADYSKQQEQLFKGFLKDEFREWRKRQMKEFESYKKQFMLTPNQSVSLDGSVVRYQDITDETSALIAELDALVRAAEGEDVPAAAPAAPAAKAAKVGKAAPAKPAGREESAEVVSDTGMDETGLNADLQAEMDLEAEHGARRAAKQPEEKPGRSFWKKKEK